MKFFLKKILLPETSSHSALETIEEDNESKKDLVFWEDQKKLETTLTAIMDRLQAMETRQDPYYHAIQLTCKFVVKFDF